MQKEKLLSELYNGNLCPIAKKVVQGSEYQKCMNELAEIEEKFSSKLDAEEKEKLQDFVTAQGKLSCINGEERFTQGFRMGAKLILEIMNKDDGELEFLEN